MNERVTVYKQQAESFYGNLCAITFALNRAGRVTELSTEQDEKGVWWLLLKAVVPVPRKVREIIEGA